MNDHQMEAITNPCYEATDTTAARYYRDAWPYRVGLTVNSGFE